MIKNKNKKSFGGLYRQMGTLSCRRDSDLKSADVQCFDLFDYQLSR